MYECNVAFELRGKSLEVCRFEGDEIELDEHRVRLRTIDERGRVIECSLTITAEDINLAKNEARRLAERLRLLLSLVLKGGFDIWNMRIDCAAKVTEKGPKIVLHEEIRIIDEVEIQVLRRPEDIKAELAELARKIKNLGDSGRSIMRAIKWWVKGKLEEDKVDAFIHYFIAFEILANVTKHSRSSYGNSWAEIFSKKYGILYKLDDSTFNTINRLRGALLHEPGSDKDRAEELARKYADTFGESIGNAIEKIIEDLQQRDMK